MTIFYCLQLQTPTTWRTRSPYLYSPKTGCPNYTPRKRVPFSSPSSDRRTTVEAIWLNATQSESELLHDWPFTAHQFVLTTSPLRLTTTNFIFQLNTCGYSTYVTSSLTRGWICSLQFLLVLVSAVILRSEFRGTHDHILLSQIWDSPNLEGQVPVFISLRNTVAQLYPQALGSLFVASHDSQGPHRKRLSLLRVLSLLGNVSTELFPSNGCCTAACLHSCYLAMGIHITLLRP
jgi:hypothetical protein